MRTLEQIAVDVLRCAVSHEPESRILGNVPAAELVALAAPHVMMCPSCGSEAWVNIDCDLCLVVNAVSNGEIP